MALIATPSNDANDPYPAYTRAELWADFTLHTLGLVLASLALLWLAGLFGGGVQGWGLYLACLVYGLCLLASNGAALLYHSLPIGGHRHLYRRIDHAAIFLLIAGTYTPFVMLIDTWFATFILTLVWMAALNLAVRRIAFWQAPGDRGYLWYLALGWAALALVWSMYARLPGPTFALILSGGVLYSVGVCFYVQKQLRFSNAIWHGFVLLGSASFFSGLVIAIR